MSTKTPLTQADIKPITWVRIRVEQPQYNYLIIGVSEWNIAIHTPTGFKTYTYQDLMHMEWEYSYDLVSWLPCSKGKIAQADEKYAAIIREDNGGVVTAVRQYRADHTPMPSLKDALKIMNQIRRELGYMDNI